jgi:NAD(P)-dependent dehydrogenase (short-subunit alcohol dehydrogenase family)
MTGASRKIGLSVVRHFAHAGALVVLCGRNISALLQETQQILASGGRIFAMKIEIQTARIGQQRINGKLTQFGQIDTLLNNADILSPITRSSRSHPTNWREGISMNLTETFLLA